MNHAQRLALLAGLGVAVVTAYACTGDDSSTTTPPLNDAGPTTDTGAPPTNDGSTPPGDGGAPTGDAGTPLCSSLPGTIKYINSADTQEAMLDNVGRQLRDKANVTIAFQLTGSCTITAGMYTGGNPTVPTPFPANTTLFYIPSTAEDPTWTPTPGPSGGGELTCTTGSATPSPDMGIAALYPSSCAGYSALPQGNIAQYVGPTQAYTMVVPTAQFTNGQTSIAAEEAYYTFGWGAQDPVVPATWNDPTQYFLRPSSKSTLLSTALNIKLPPANMVDLGADGGTADGRNLVPSSGGVVTAVTGATGGKAIGILGDEVYDSDRSGLNVLAFQDYGQNYAYFPDSTQTSYDRQNIRDGHYGLWSPDVYMAPSTSGKPTDPTIAYIIDVILGNPNATPPPGAPDGGAPIDSVTLTASVGLTPSCAMQVVRQGGVDGAQLIANPNYANAPCTCKFLSAVPGISDGGTPLPATCLPCTTSADCSSIDAGVIGCFNGYCEVTPTPITPPANDAGGTCDNSSIINACTNATQITKAVTYPDDAGSPPQ